MVIKYTQRGLTPEQVSILEANGWKIEYYKDIHACNLKNGLYLGRYLGYSASKDCADLKEAVFEIERLLSVDVMQTDHDGCEVHWFHWGDNMLASGWDCLREMYGAPRTPREAAIELCELRKRIKDDSGTGQETV